jgi:putative membrane protein
MKFLKRLLAGMGIGVGAAIPGVSGAAIAVIFRVYEDIIDAVNNFRKKFGYSILVLIPILLGIVLAVIPCIYLFSLAFEHLMFVLICIFAGFLIGSFPSITEKVKGIKPNKLQIALIITGALFVIALGVLSVAFGDKINIGGLFVNIYSNWWLYLVLIPVGVLAAVALTVPGLSGSLILLVIGFYRPLVDSAKGWGSMCMHGDWSMIGPLLGVIGCFGLGCLIGVVLVSKVMTLLLKKFRDNTFFTIIGFIAGSIAVLFFNYQIFNYYLHWAGRTTLEVINPVLPMWLEMLIGFVVLGACAVGSYMLVRLERKNRKPIEQEQE